MPRRRNHPGSIDKRGPAYRVRLSVDGTMHSFTLKNVTREQAEQFATEKDLELRKRAKAGLGNYTRFSTLLKRYEKVELPTKAPKTQETYGDSFKGFRSYFVKLMGDPFLHQVRRGHVASFLHWRADHRVDGKARKTSLSARTLAKDRACLHAVFAFAELLELADNNPVRKVPIPKGDEREPIILTEKEYDRLVKGARNLMVRTYILVLGEAGLRANSEALWLRWQDLDLKGGFLTVESVRKGRRTKSGKARKVPLTPRLKKALGEHQARYRMQIYRGDRSPWVFHHVADGPKHKAGARIGNLRKSFDAAAEKAEVPSGLTQHDLRHRRVTTWLQAGKPAHLVQKAMGHSDLRTTLRYEHLVPDDLLALVDTAHRIAGT